MPDQEARTLSEDSALDVRDCGRPGGHRIALAMVAISVSAQIDAQNAALRRQFRHHRVPPVTVRGKAVYEGHVALAVSLCTEGDRGAVDHHGPRSRFHNLPSTCNM